VKFILSLSTDNRKFIFDRELIAHLFINCKGVLVRQVLYDKIIKVVLNRFIGFYIKRFGKGCVLLQKFVPLNEFQRSLPKRFLQNPARQITNFRHYKIWVNLNFFAPREFYGKSDGKFNGKSA
jgi:hypothetical protein